MVMMKMGLEMDEIAIVVQDLLAASREPENTLYGDYIGKVFP